MERLIKGRAEQVIHSLKLADENYNVVLQLIKECCNNKCVIVQKHVRTLINLPTIVKESASVLREPIYSMNTHLYALKSLCQLTDFWDTLLIYIFTGKLDRVSQQERKERLRESLVFYKVDVETFEIPTSICQTNRMSFLNKIIGENR
jgi:hypothetical protein